MAYSTSASVFLLGATGYIGGSFLSHLLELPEPPREITTLSRSADKIQAFERLSTSKTQLSGQASSYQDEEVVARLAASADIVVSAADSDDIPMITGILRGIKQRYEATGKQGVLIHVSGTDELVVDDARGNAVGQEIFTDLPRPSVAHPDYLPIASLPDTALHRHVDSRIDAADREGYVRTYIIMPGTVWGTPTGVAFDRRFSNPFSQQIPDMIHLALQTGQAVRIGRGINHWVQVHIDDVRSLFGLIYPRALRDDLPHGGPEVSGYYLGIADEYVWGQAVDYIGDELHLLGLIKTASARAGTEEELRKQFTASMSEDHNWTYLGKNCRGVAEHSFGELGWKPVHGVGHLKGEWEEYVRSETRRIAQATGKK